MAIIAHTDDGVSATVPEMFREWITRGLRKPGKDQYGLARVLGVDRSAVSKLVSGVRQLKADEIDKVAQYLEEAPPDRIMPVRYHIGAGQEVFALDDDAPSDYQAVSGMWGVECEMAIVRGDSMWPLLGDGDRIFIGPAREPTPNDHGHRRAVRLADDRMLIKVMRKTPDPRVWTLQSFNAPDIEDVVVLAVSPILRIEPRS